MPNPAIINNMTDNELVVMCFDNECNVCPDIVRELAERLESRNGELQMFKTLNDKVVDVNARLQVELGMYMTEIRTITEG